MRDIVAGYFEAQAVGPRGPFSAGTSAGFSSTAPGVSEGDPEHAYQGLVEELAKQGWHLLPERTREGWHRFKRAVRPEKVSDSTATIP